MNKFIIIIFIILLTIGFLFFGKNHRTGKKQVASIDTNALVDLGRHLFYERNLSINKTKSCGTCHAQEFSFTDGYKKSTGAFGDNLQRNAKPLINLINNTFFTAGDSTIKTLERQIIKPMFNNHPIEMGIIGNEKIILQRIAADTKYQNLFKTAFKNDKNNFTIKNIQMAIIAFESTINSYNSSYDKYINGNSTALSTMQKVGMQLFFSKKINCANCHGGNDFDVPSFSSNITGVNFYQNIGLYNINNNYPSYDQGLFETTKNENDKGKFKIPTLRNLAFTAPYFHDGSVETLHEVIAIYAKGGRNINYGTYKGNGAKNKNKSELVKGFSLTLDEKKALISFLISLSDSTILKNKAYANPFVDETTQ